MSRHGGGGKTPRSPPTLAGLPQILGGASKATPRPASNGPAGRHSWTARAESPKVSSTPRKASNYAYGVVWPGAAWLPPDSPGAPERLGSEASRRTCETLAEAPRMSERPSMQHVMRWVDRELHHQGLQGAGPSLDRIGIFSSAFGEVIDMLPSYRPFLLAVQKEYDALVMELQAELSATAPLEGRLKTIKAEGLSFVGESMTWFQAEIDKLKRNLCRAESERDTIAEEKRQLSSRLNKLQDASEKDKETLTVCQAQNMDILNQLQRLQQQVEILQNRERVTDAVNKGLEDKLKKMEKRNQASEELISVERAKVANMVPREKFDEVMEQTRHLTHSNRELKEMYEAKHKDYLSVVQMHTSKTGQTLSRDDQVKPLTPRPKWSHCGGMLDPEDARSHEKAEGMQETMQGLLLRSRTLLCAYGLSAASQKSKVFMQHALPTTLSSPLVGTGPPGQVRTRASAEMDGGASSKPGQLSETVGEDAAERDSALGAAAGSAGEPLMLSPDFDEDAPEELRPSGTVPNLFFSRRKVMDFIEGLLERKQKYSPHSFEPFAKFLSTHLPDGEPNEHGVFTANIWAGVRRYSAEPDFLAYSLLLKNRISYSVIRDNKGMCKELLHLFSTEYENDDDTDLIPKQRFFYDLQEVLPNKTEELWQDLSTVFPSGSPETIVNYRWLLQDDLYVISPIVYTLRLQHLEECLRLTEKLETLTLEVAKGSPKTVTLAAVEEVFSRIHPGPELPDSPSIQDSIQDHEMTAILRHAFQTHVLEGETEHEWDKFIEALKHGEIFHTLYFPELLPEEDEEM